MSIKQRKPVWKGHIRLYNCKAFWKRQNQGDREKISGCERKERKSLNYIVMVGTCQCKFVHTHGTCNTNSGPDCILQSLEYDCILFCPYILQYGQEGVCVVALVSHHLAEPQNTPIKHNFKQRSLFSMVTQSFLVMLFSSLDKYFVLEVFCLQSDKEKISKLEIIDQVFLYAAH